MSTTIETPLQMLAHIQHRLEAGQRDLAFFDDWDEYVQEVIDEIDAYLIDAESEPEVA